MEYPGGKKQHFRYLLFFAFYRGQKAAEAARDICKEQNRIEENRTEQNRIYCFARKLTHNRRQYRTIQARKHRKTLRFSSQDAPCLLSIKH